jgi:hypothetical protein
MTNPYQAPSGHSPEPDPPTLSARLENQGRLIVIAFVGINSLASLSLLGLAIARSHSVPSGLLVAIALEMLLYWQAILGRTWVRLVMVLFCLFALIGAVVGGDLRSATGIVPIVLTGLAFYLFAFNRSVAAHFER